MLWKFVSIVLVFLLFGTPALAIEAEAVNKRRRYRPQGVRSRGLLRG